MDRWHDKDRQAIEAGADQASLDAFVSENKNFILRCASKTCRRFVTETDEEFEVALDAFEEAVTTFDAETGGFSGYAGQVIRRRLMDYFEKKHRRKTESPLGRADLVPSDADPLGEVPEFQQAVAARSLDPEHTVRDEVDAMADLLKEYGFSLFDLAEVSPRSKKTRGCCARAIAWMLEQPARVSKMRQRHTLPVMELSTACEISHRIVDRHRRYIIAATEILGGDFPHLAGYLREMKRIQP